jgi:hypothetical protein
LLVNPSKESKIQERTGLEFEKEQYGKHGKYELSQTPPHEQEHLCSAS